MSKKIWSNSDLVNIIGDIYRQLNDIKVELKCIKSAPFCCPKEDESVNEVNKIYKQFKIDEIKYDVKEFLKKHWVMSLLKENLKVYKDIDK